MLELKWTSFRFFFFCSILRVRPLRFRTAENASTFRKNMDKYGHGLATLGWHFVRKDAFAQAPILNVHNKWCLLVMNEVYWLHGQYSTCSRKTALQNNLWSCEFAEFNGECPRSKFDQEHDQADGWKCPLQIGWRRRGRYCVAGATRQEFEAAEWFEIDRARCTKWFQLLSWTFGGAVANRLRRRTPDQTVLGSNPVYPRQSNPRRSKPERCTRAYYGLDDFYAARQASRFRPATA